MALLVGLLVLCASWGAGWAVTGGGRLGVAEPLRRAATQFAAGFALLELLALAFGYVHLFRPAVLDVVACAFGAVGVWRLAAARRALPRAWRGLGRERILLAAAAAVAVVDLVLAAAPPTSGDALAYHLVGPKLWLQRHDMFAIWWNWPTFQPFATEMHFAYAQALWSGAAAIVVGAGLTGLTAVAVYGLTRELAGPRAAAVAALLWVGQGAVLWEATGGFVDVVLSGLLVLAAWHVAAFVRERRPNDVVWAGFCAGLAASTKVHGLLVLPFLALVPIVVVGAPRDRLAALGRFALGALVALPWYVRAWVVTGNPFYPLGFGGRYWNAAAQADYVRSWRGDGIHGIWHLPFFPLEFVLQTAHYERGYSFSVALFVLMPLALVFSRRGWVRLLAIAICIYLVLWWQGMHQATRYVLPALAFGSALAGYAAVRLWETRWGRAIVAGVAAVSAVLLVAITGLYARQVLPGVVGTEATPAFVQRLTGTQTAYDWIDAHLPANGRVAMIGFRNLYWLDHPYVRYSAPLFPSGNPPAVARRRLEQQDVRWVATLAGAPPAWLAPRLRLLKVLPAQNVTSRTLGRVARQPELVRVYAWR
jgi:4-amino-4-deoxy-L-arabinose transferase-like glycosyltransferase